MFLCHSETQSLTGSRPALASGLARPSMSRTATEIPVLADPPRAKLGTSRLRSRSDGLEPATFGVTGRRLQKANNRNGV